MVSIWEKLKPRSKSIHKPRKRLGRGNGSGKGNTSGRGPEGQRSRSGHKIGNVFQGGQNPLVKRLPLLRGARNNHRSADNVKKINLSDLEMRFEAGKIDLREILSWKPGDETKLLGTGDVTKKFEITTHKASASAVAKIEKAGGKVTLIK